MDSDGVDQSFNPSQVQDLISTTVKGILKNREFQSEKVNEWLSAIFEDICRKLSLLGLRFKYCCTGTITQNCGAGLMQCNSGRIEKNSDAYAFFKYQESTILCVITVYGFRI